MDVKSLLVEVSCFSTTQVSWLNPRMERIHWDRLRNNTLVFTDVDYKDTGKYTCVGTTMAGEFVAEHELLVAGNYGIIY